jgi:hypothetical protein
MRTTLKRKKLLGYFYIACVITVLALVHNVLGNHHGFNPAHALPSSYDDDTAIPPRTLGLLKGAVYRPDNLLHVMAKDISVLLGVPEMVRLDAPTMVWQYRNGECVLDVYFKAKDEDDLQAPVSHYEIRAREQGTPDYQVNRHCLRDLVAQRSAPRMVDVSKIYKQPI